MLSFLLLLRFKRVMTQTLEKTKTRKITYTKNIKTGPENVSRFEQALGGGGVNDASALNLPPLKSVSCTPVDVGHATRQRRVSLAHTAYRVRDRPWSRRPGRRRTTRRRPRARSVARRRPAAGAPTRSAPSTSSTPCPAWPRT